MLKILKNQKRRSGHLTVPVDELLEVLVPPQHRLCDQVLVRDADRWDGRSARRVRQPSDLRGLLVVSVLQIQLCIKRHNFSFCVSRYKIKKCSKKINCNCQEKALFCSVSAVNGEGIFLQKFQIEYLFELLICARHILVGSKYNPCYNDTNNPLENRSTYI